ncbi:zinc metalloproteinase nas-8-like [Atheta coriaria]|uniref:zinc metalloproteinase nas-8-like n=1 Tax=Dalotia coriaria TaxID=877792 RepID=UPI0031F3C3BB
MQVAMLKCLTIFTIWASVVFAAPAEHTKMINLSFLGSAPLGSPSRETGRRLEGFDPAADDAVNPEELGEYFEGDILFPNGRNGLIAEVSHWKDGIIPYEIRGSFNQRELGLISDAMDAYKHYTCLRFRPRASTDVDYVVLENANTGCWSSVGRVGGKQVVNLQTPGCFSQVGTPIHELMHAAGFMHEQNRFERDDNVDIVWSNIQAGRNNNFQKIDEKTISGYGVPYDFNSVMHYSEKAFSKNGQATIIARRKPDGVIKMGQRAGFSKGDVMKLRRMYQCPNADAPIESKAEPSTGSSGNGGQPANNGLGNLLNMIFG